VATVSHGGHFLSLDRPRELTSQLVKFLERRPAAHDLSN